MGKNNEPLSIYNGFPKIIGDMSPDSLLAKKYKAGKTNTTEIIEDSENHFLVLKKPDVHGVCLGRQFYGGCSLFCFCFFVFILLSRKSDPSATLTMNP